MTGRRAAGPLHQAGARAPVLVPRLRTLLFCFAYLLTRICEYQCCVSSLPFMAQLCV